MQDSGFRFHVAGCKLHVTVCSMQYAGCRMQISICRMQAAGKIQLLRLQVSDCGLQVTGCRCRIQVAGCRLQDGRAHTHFICPKPTFCLAGHRCAVQVAHLLSRDSTSLPGYLLCACGACSGIYGAPTARRACGADRLLS